MSVVAGACYAPGEPTGETVFDLTHGGGGTGLGRLEQRRGALAAADHAYGFYAHSYVSVRRISIQLFCMAE